MKKCSRFCPMVLIALACLSIALFLGSARTGYLILNPEAELSVDSHFSGQLTAFSYNREIDIEERQQITVEFTNVGNVPFEVNMSVYVYYRNKTGLMELAHYSDSLAYLSAGMRKSFTSVFAPSEKGEHYIKVVVVYGQRRMVTWGYFNVVIRPEKVIVFVPGEPIPQPGPPIITPIFIVPRMETEHQQLINMTAGESTTVPVRIKNTGDMNLTDIRFYVSAPQMIYVDVSPKIVSFLPIGRNYTFLLSIETDNYTAAGNYSIDFSIVSKETSINSTITLNVKEKQVPKIYDSEAMRQKILSYFYILSELEARASFLAREGFDIIIANSSISSARSMLSLASGYFEQGDYENCVKALESAKNMLETAALELESITLKIYGGGPSLFYIALFALLVAAAVFAVYEYRKRRDMRPRILRKEETAE